jgi:hypothetical protein
MAAQLDRRGKLVLAEPPFRLIEVMLHSHKAAGVFAHGDLFVVNDVVRDWQIREWDEALLPRLMAWQGTR